MGFSSTIPLVSAYVLKSHHVCARFRIRIRRTSLMLSETDVHKNAFGLSGLAGLGLTIPIFGLSLVGHNGGLKQPRQQRRLDCNYMTQTISIIGKSESGKTTLIEKLIPEMKRRGYRVGSVKHAAHGFDMDQEGKDSFRHQKAGAEIVAVASPHQIVLIKNVASDSLESLETYFRELDLLFVEGYKKEKRPKIEVFSAEYHKKPINPHDENLFAFVTDDSVEVRVPRFRMDQIKELADLIEKKYPVY
jgi:molybdopterin-guanine dinucleotide biosynthesis adapter protein